MSKRHPFLLFHWSPRSRRKSILKYGLKPGCRSNMHTSSDPAIRYWLAPYVCWAKSPSYAWAASAAYARRAGQWDLWCTWSDMAGKYVTRTCGKQWWQREYRTVERVKKMNIWYVGSRKFTPRKKRK